MLSVEELFLRTDDSFSRLPLWIKNSKVIQHVTDVDEDEDDDLSDRLGQDEPHPEFLWWTPQIGILGIHVAEENAVDEDVEHHGDEGADDGSDDGSFRHDTLPAR